MLFHRSCGVLLGLMWLPIAGGAGVMTAQQVSTPGLHQRSDPSGADLQPPEVESGRSQISTLPDDVSGSYHFTHYNDSIEIDLDHNRRGGRSKLSGYVSQLGDEGTHSMTPLTFFFDKTSVDGGQIAFQTRVVHGIWYSFHGTIVRGRAETRDEDGYYVLHGTLLEHHPQGDGKSADETIARRVVNFKSMGR